jgi:hypothetical protein
MLISLKYQYPDLGSQRISVGLKIGALKQSIFQVFFVLQWVILKILQVFCRAGLKWLRPDFHPMIEL